MSLSIGIVGLPNVGKSSLFNTLTKAQTVAAANYPFCTIEPNKAVLPFPTSASLSSPSRVGMLRTEAKSTSSAMAM